MFKKTKKRRTERDSEKDKKKKERGWEKKQGQEREGLKDKGLTVWRVWLCPETATPEEPEDYSCWDACKHRHTQRHEITQNTQWCSLCTFTRATFNDCEAPEIEWGLADLKQFSESLI